MKCTNNPKSWLFFKWDGECDPQDTYIRASAFNGDSFVDTECKLCGCQTLTVRRRQQPMVELGYDLKKLKAMSYWDELGKKPEELKDDARI